jgi:2,3-bisphosphoglycerate-independent phosphoglycerate mutase
MFWKKRTLKGVFVILDGLGDLPNKQLANFTPLEAAHKPNLNFLASRGELGYMYPVKQGFVPGSDEAIVSVFGNNLEDSSRGQLEAIGAGIKMKKGDLALRVNFATIDSIEKGNVVDRRSGRNLTSAEAKILARSINLIDFPFKFEFVATIQHRASLVFFGDFSNKISNNDSEYLKSSLKGKIIPCASQLKSNEKAIKTASMINDFLKKVYEVLENHPVNLERKRKGFLPANYLLVRGAGVEKPKLRQYKNWYSAHYMPLEIGFSNVSGIKNFGFRYPDLKGIDSYKNLWDGLKLACSHSIKVIKKAMKNAEYVYIHIKETDLPGHDNKPIEKKMMIEYIDKTLFRYLRKVAPMYNINVVVTGDHSTPCKLKAHSADPVPVLFYNHSLPKEKEFCEKASRRGTLGRIFGHDLLKKVGFRK